MEIIYPTPKSSYIVGRFIPKELCDALENKYCQNLEKGYFTDGDKAEVFDDNIKESFDRCFDLRNLTKLENIYIEELQKCISSYNKRYPFSKRLNHFGIESINYQRYPKGGGYKAWHTENLFLSTDLIVNTRILVFMTYLNDIVDGGTLFAEQELYVPALKGLTLIWPAGFTHPHKSQVTHSSEKSIITGWLCHTFANKTDETFNKGR